MVSPQCLVQTSTGEIGLFAGADWWGNAPWSWTDVLDGFVMAVGIVLGVLGLIALVGSFLARRCVVSRTLTTELPVEAVWQVITDYQDVPSWYSNIRSVERLPDRQGRPVWREQYRWNYSIQVEDAEVVPPQRLLRRIADEKGPFMGSWEFDLAPAEEGGCRITLTERGEIANPYFRLMARLRMNQALYVILYLKALAGRLGGHCVLEEPRG